MRRVFISHRNGEPEVRELIDELSRSLTGDGFDVMVDFERLQPGAMWCDDIYTWLGVCHAAVALISPAALAPDSVWVPRECSILCWRRSLEKGFKLLPVLLPGVTPDALRADLRYRDLSLHQQQVILHEDPGSTCSAVRQALAPLAAAKTRLEELAELVEVQLDGIRPEALEDALPLCRVPRAALPGFGGPARRLALALLQAPLVDALKALEHLAPRSSRPAAVREILELIAPGWVDLDAARWISHCTLERPSRPAAVLNARSRFAARMYVRRASSTPPVTAPRVVCVTGVHGELMVEDLAAEVLAALRAEFAGALLQDPFWEGDPDAQLIALLQQLDDLGRSVVVVLPLPRAARELVPVLQERFPFLVFIFLSGEALPDEQTCPAPLLRRVEPALTRGREQQAMTHYQTALTILSRGS